MKHSGGNPIWLPNPSGTCAHNLLDFCKWIVAYLHMPKDNTMTEQTEMLEMGSL